MHPIHLLFGFIIFFSFSASGQGSLFYVGEFQTASNLESNNIGHTSYISGGKAKLKIDLQWLEEYIELANKCGSEDDYLLIEIPIPTNDTTPQPTLTKERSAITITSKGADKAEPETTKSKVVLNNHPSIADISNFVVSWIYNSKVRLNKEKEPYPLENGTVYPLKNSFTVRDKNLEFKVTYNFNFFVNIKGKKKVNYRIAFFHVNGVAIEKYVEDFSQNKKHRYKIIDAIHEHISSVLYTMRKEITGNQFKMTNLFEDNSYSKIRQKI